VLHDQEDGPQHGRVARPLDTHDGGTRRVIIPFGARTLLCEIRRSMATSESVVKMDGRARALWMTNADVVSLAHQSDLRRGQVLLC
jgi:hypothetical protein